MSMIQPPADAPPASDPKIPVNVQTPTPPPAEPPKADPAAPPAGDRPAWLPEKFKSAEDLAKSYGELETWRGKKEEELTAGLLKDRPEALDKYELPAFDATSPVDSEALAKHPLVEWWRDQAFKRGLSQDEFKAGINNYVNALAANLPDVTKEMAALGENASARLEAVNAWANSTFTDKDEFAAIQQLGTSAAGIKAVERMMKAARGGGPDIAGDGDGRMDPVDPVAEKKRIDGLMASKEYYHPAHRDPKVVAQVEAYFAKQYGG